MANTYEIISKVTVGSGGTTVIDFTSIPSTYTDLLLKLSIRNSQSSGSWNDAVITFNGTTYTLSQIRITGVPPATGSSTETSIRVRVNNAGTTANTFGNAELYFPNYTSANFKSISIDEVTENNATSAWASLVAGLVQTTAAISRITITASTDNWVENSTAYLYGIKNS